MIEQIQLWYSGLAKQTFSYKDLIGQDRWETWTPVDSGFVNVGTPTYYGRFREVGKQMFFQITIMAGTTTSSVAGTSYFGLPKQAVGLSGMTNAFDATALTPIDVCSIAVAASRVYTPAWAATGNVIKIAGWYEV